MYMYAIMAVRQYYVREISELRLTFWDVNLIIKISFNCQFLIYIILSRSKSFLKRAILVTWICFTIHGFMLLLSHMSIIIIIQNHLVREGGKLKMNSSELAQFVLTYIKRDREKF